MMDLDEVEAEVPIQQSVQAGGATLQTQCATFLEGSVALAWRGDGQHLVSVTQACDECAFTVPIFMFAAV
jgi:hypothetical protein